MLRPLTVSLLVCDFCGAQWEANRAAERSHWRAAWEADAAVLHAARGDGGMHIPMGSAAVGGPGESEVGGGRGGVMCPRGSTQEAQLLSWAHRAKALDAELAAGTCRDFALTHCQYCYTLLALTCIVTHC